MGGRLDLIDKPAFTREVILKALADDRALEDRRISKACFFVRTGSRRAG
jgi:hypothetical protein